jgi:pilus assembly protein CpaF
LVKNALRMRPDRIVVGEIRDGAALDMLQAMNTGHAGSLTTVHANSARDALSRLETMVLMAGMDLPMRAIRDQVSQAIDLVVQQSRMRDGSRRITEVVEVVGIQGDEIVTRKLFDFDFAPDESDEIGDLRALGQLPTRIDKFSAAGVPVSEEWFGVGASGRNRRSR